MKGFCLVIWTSFVMAFWGYYQFSDAAKGKFRFGIEIGKLPSTPNLKSINWTCCKWDAPWSVSKVTNYKFNIDCAVNFWNSSCFILLGSVSNDPVKEVTVYTQQPAKKLLIQFVRSLNYLRFTYTDTSRSYARWTLTVNTANTSGTVNGRIYITTNCENYNRATKVPLANSFDNFKPGQFDVFNFEARRLAQEQYCVEISNSLPEKWIWTSMVLRDNSHKKTYNFFHGERSIDLKYYGFQGSHAINWTIEVVTGDVGTDYNVDITLINGQCRTRVTLDNEEDNFQPGTTDVFNFKAKNCNGLEKIEIKCQDYWGNWELITLTATPEDGPPYVFHHNETLWWSQTFYVNQASGPNEWEVSVCSKTSTDNEVWVILTGRYGTSAKIRLTTEKDDFEANQCSNFTLFLRELGKLWTIEMSKDKKFKVTTITFKNKGKVYTFQAPTEQGHILKLIYYDEEVEIFRPSIPEGEKVRRKCAGLCIKDPTCLKFHTDNGKCKFNPEKPIPGNTYTFLDEMAVWTLDIYFDGIVNEVRATLVAWDGKDIIYTYTNPPTKHVTTSFSVLNTFFDVPQNIILDYVPVPTDHDCENIEIHVNKSTSTHIRVLNLKKTDGCTWKNLGYSKIYKRAIRAETTTDVDMSSPLSTTYSEGTISMNDTGSTTHNTGSTIHNTGSTTPMTTDLTNTKTGTMTKPTMHSRSPIGNSTDSYTNVTQTTNSNTNSSTTETEITTGVENRTTCKCMCQKILSKEEEVEHMKELVKELKVNKNETSGYLRSKTSAPDERVSSKVIGSTIVIVMAVPFGLIFLVDLIPLFSFIYNKIVSHP